MSEYVNKVQSQTKSADRYGDRDVVPASLAMEFAARLEGRLEDCKTNLTELSEAVHAANIRWWEDPRTGQPILRNKGELLALIHSEISEALEGERKDLMDDKLPHRKMAEVELADAIIRILDYSAGFGYDIQGAFDDKMAYNAKRHDHTHEARLADGGKRF